MTYEYKTLSAATTAALDEQVNKHQADGWDLWGNQYGLQERFSIDPFDGNSRHYQVVVRLKSTGISFGREAVYETELPRPAGFSVFVPETPDLQPAAPPNHEDFRDLAAAFSSVLARSLSPLPKVKEG